MAHLEGIHNKLFMGHNSYRKKLQANLWKEYNRILFQEEVYVIGLDMGTEILSSSMCLQ